MGKWDAASAAVLNAVVDIERHIFGVSEPSVWGAMEGGFFGGFELGGGAAEGGFHFASVSGGLGVFGVKLVPFSDVTDAAPGTDTCPDFWVSACHEECHVSAAADADEVDACWVDVGLLFCPSDGFDDVLHGAVGAHGLWGFIWAAEVGVDECPALVDAPFCVDGVAACGGVVTAPCVKADEEWFFLWVLRRIPHGELRGVVADGDFDFLHRAGPGFWGWFGRCLCVGGDGDGDKEGEDGEEAVHGVILSMDVTRVVWFFLWMIVLRVGLFCGNGGVGAT